MCLGHGRLVPAWLRLGWAWLIWKWSALARWPGTPRPGLGSGPCSGLALLTGPRPAWPRPGQPILFRPYPLHKSHIVSHFCYIFESVPLGKNDWAWPGLAQAGPGWAPLCLGPGRLGPAWLRLGWAWLIWKWSALARWPGPPPPGLGSGPCSGLALLTGPRPAWPRSG